MVRLTDFRDQPSAPPQFYLNQQQQNAIPLAPVQPVSIAMNTQSSVLPSLPQPQAEQSSPEWQKSSVADAQTASVFQTEQQQVEEKVGRIEYLENDGILKWNKNLTENNSQRRI